MEPSHQFAHPVEHTSIRLNRRRLRSRISVLLVLALMFGSLPVFPVSVSTTSGLPTGAALAQGATSSSEPTTPGSSEPATSSSSEPATSSTSTYTPATYPVNVPGRLGDPVVTAISPYQLEVSWDASVLTEAIALNSQPLSKWWVVAKESRHFTTGTTIDGDGNNLPTIIDSNPGENEKNFPRVITPDQNGMVSTVIGLNHADYPSNFLTSYGLEPGTAYHVWVHAGRTIDVPTTCPGSPDPNLCHPSGQLTVYGAASNRESATTMVAPTTTTIPAPSFDWQGVEMTLGNSNRLQLTSVRDAGTTYNGDTLEDILVKKGDPQQARHDLIPVDDLDVGSTPPHFAIKDRPDLIAQAINDLKRAAEAAGATQEEIDAIGKDDITDRTIVGNPDRFLAIYPTNGSPPFEDEVMIGVRPDSNANFVVGTTYRLNLVVSRQIRSGIGLQSSDIIDNETSGNRGEDILPVEVLVLAEQHIASVPQLADVTNFTVKPFTDTGMALSWDRVPDVGGFNTFYELQYKKNTSSVWSRVISLSTSNLRHTDALLLNQPTVDDLDPYERIGVDIIQTSSLPGDLLPEIETGTQYDLRIRSANAHIARSNLELEPNRGSWVEASFTTLTTNQTSQPFWLNDSVDLTMVADQNAYKSIGTITPLNPDDIYVDDLGFTLSGDNSDDFLFNIVGARYLRNNVSTSSTSSSSSSITAPPINSPEFEILLKVNPDVELSQLEDSYTLVLDMDLIGNNIGSNVDLGDLTVNITVIEPIGTPQNPQLTYTKKYRPRKLTLPKGASLSLDVEPWFTVIQPPSNTSTTLHTDFMVGCDSSGTLSDECTAHRTDLISVNVPASTSSTSSTSSSSSVPGSTSSTSSSSSVPGSTSSTSSSSSVPGSTSSTSSSSSVPGSTSSTSSSSSVPGSTSSTSSTTPSNESPTTSITTVTVPVVEARIRDGNLTLTAAQNTTHNPAVITIDSGIDNDQTEGWVEPEQAELEVQVVDDRYTVRKGTETTIDLNNWFLHQTGESFDLEVRAFNAGSRFMCTFQVLLANGALLDRRGDCTESLPWSVSILSHHNQNYPIIDWHPLGVSSPSPQDIAEVSIDSNKQLTISAIDNGTLDVYITRLAEDGRLVFPHSRKIQIRVAGIVDPPEAQYKPDHISLPREQSLSVDTSGWFGILEGNPDFKILCDPSGTPDISCSTTDGSLSAAYSTIDPDGTEDEIVGCERKEDIQFQCLTITAANTLTTAPVVLTLDSGLRNGDGARVVHEMVELNISVVDDELVLPIVGDTNVDLSSWFFHQHGSSLDLTARSSRSSVATVSIDSNGQLTVSPVGPGTATITIARNMAVPNTRFRVGNPSIGAAGVRPPGGGFLRDTINTQILPDSRTITVLVGPRYFPEEIVIPQGSTIPLDVSDWFVLGPDSSEPSFMVGCDANTPASSCTSSDGSVSATLDTSTLTLTATQTLSSAPTAITIDSGLRNANSDEFVSPETATVNVSVVSDDYSYELGEDHTLDLSSWFYHKTGGSFQLDVESSDDNIATVSIDADELLTVSPVAAGNITITITRQSGDTNTVVPDSRTINVTITPASSSSLRFSDNPPTSQSASFVQSQPEALRQSSSPTTSTTLFEVGYLFSWEPAPQNNWPDPVTHYEVQYWTDKRGLHQVLDSATGLMIQVLQPIRVTNVIVEATETTFRLSAYDLTQGLDAEYWFRVRALSQPTVEECAERAAPDPNQQGATIGPCLRWIDVAKTLVSEVDEMGNPIATIPFYNTGAWTEPVSLFPKENPAPLTSPTVNLVSHVVPTFQYRDTSTQFQRSAEFQGSTRELDRNMVRIIFDADFDEESNRYPRGIGLNQPLRRYCGQVPLVSTATTLPASSTTSTTNPTFTCLETEHIHEYTMPIEVQYRPLGSQDEWTSFVGGSFSEGLPHFTNGQGQYIFSSDPEREPLDDTVQYEFRMRIVSIRAPGPWSQVVAATEVNIPERIVVPTGETLEVDLDTWFTVIQGTPSYMIRCEPSEALATSCSDPTETVGEDFYSASVTGTGLSSTLSIVGGETQTIEDRTLTVDVGWRSFNSGQSAFPDTLDIEIGVASDEYYTLVGQDLVVDVTDWFRHTEGSDFDLDIETTDTGILTATIDSEEVITISPIAVGSTTIILTPQTVDQMVVSPASQTITVSVIDPEIPSATDPHLVVLGETNNIDLSAWFAINDGNDPTWSLADTDTNATFSVSGNTLSALGNELTADGTVESFTISHNRPERIFPTTRTISYIVWETPHSPTDLALPRGTNMTLDIADWFRLGENSTATDFMLSCDSGTTLAATCTADDGSFDAALTGTSLTITASTTDLTSSPIALIIDSGLRSVNAGELVLPDTLSLNISVVSEIYSLLLGNDLMLDISSWFIHQDGETYTLDAVPADANIAIASVDNMQQLTVSPVSAGNTTISISRQTADRATVRPESRDITINVLTEPPVRPNPDQSPLVLGIGFELSYTISDWFATSPGLSPIWTIDSSGPSATFSVEDNTLLATGTMLTADGTTETFTISHDHSGLIFPATQTIHYVVLESPNPPRDLDIPQGTEVEVEDISDWFVVTEGDPDFTVSCDSGQTFGKECTTEDGSVTVTLDEDGKLTITADDETTTTTPVEIIIDSGLDNNVDGEGVLPEQTTINVSVVSDDGNLYLGDGDDQEENELEIDVSDWFFDDEGEDFQLEVPPNDPNDPNHDPNGYDPNVVMVEIDDNNQLIITPVGEGTTTILIKRPSDNPNVNPESRVITVTVDDEPPTPPNTDDKPLRIIADDDSEFDITEWFVTNPGFDPTWVIDSMSDPTAPISIDGDSLVVTNPTLTPDGTVHTITISHPLTNGVYPPTQTISYIVVNTAPFRPDDLIIPEGNSFSINLNDWFIVGKGDADFMVSCAGGSLAVDCPSGDSSFTAAVSDSDLTIEATATPSSAPVLLTIDSGLENTNQDETVLPETTTVQVSVVSGSFSTQVGTNLMVDASGWFYHTDEDGSITLEATSGNTAAATASIDSNHQLTITPVAAGSTTVVISPAATDAETVYPASYQLAVRVTPAPSAGGGPGPFIGGAPPVVAAPAIPDYFSDDDGTTHEANINLMAHFGISRGCNPPVNNNYCPFRDISRAEMATFISRVLELAPTSTDRFDDDGESVHEGAINQMAAAGLTVGCNPGSGGDRYCPEDPVTRGEMASFLSRSLMLSEEGGDFTDIAESVHRRQIGHIALRGITRGCNPPTNDRYCPDRPITRGEMATMLVRAFPASFGGETAS